MDGTWSIGSALAVIGGLSTPGKMPGFSWSIPASRCRSGAKLRAIALETGRPLICGACSALSGRYIYPSTQSALERRFDRLSAALNDARERERFIEAFSRVLAYRVARCTKRDARHFRWFDSGDLQSVEHLELIAEIAHRTRPMGVRHWVPTREYQMVREFAKRHGVDTRSRSIVGFPNLTLRISAAEFDRPAPDIYGLPTSTAHKGAVLEGYEECPAASHPRYECGSCRKCWDHDVDTSYHARDVRLSDRRRSASFVAMETIGVL